MQPPNKVTTFFSLSAVAAISLAVSVGWPLLGPELLADDSTDVTIAISPSKPVDLPALGSRRHHTLTEAAVFAWQQFIAHTWPAVSQSGELNTRDFPDISLRYGQKGKTGQVVWETYRHKAEIFPGGEEEPSGFPGSNAANDYGYDTLPSYVYTAPDGSGYSVKPAKGQKATNAPFDNLDEVNEITLCDMSAGISNTRVLYQAKANRVLYKYSAANRLFDARVISPGQMRANTAYNLHQTDEAKFRKPYVSLPASDAAKGTVGSIEIKSAWRRLDSSEDRNRFYTNRIRYYVLEEVAGNKEFRYREEEWGLVALHIIHKTESSPVFVYTSFSQIDNIRDADGTVVEEPDGLIKSEYHNIPPFAPELVIHKSDSTHGQEVYVAPGSPGIPNGSKQLFYTNLAPFKHGVTVPVAVRRRLYEISSEVRTVNRAAQSAIREYDKNAIWQYYKLVNVQSATLPSFVDRSDVDSLSSDLKASFFMANEVVETNVPLQQFSGTLTPPPGDTHPILTFRHSGNYDYALFDEAGVYDADNKIVSEKHKGDPIYNTYLRQPKGQAEAWKKINMGGCMGCHGPQGQLVGGDFSVILARGRVAQPESTDDEGKGSIRLLERIFARKGREQVASGGRRH